MSLFVSLVLASFERVRGNPERLAMRYAQVFSHRKLTHNPVETRVCCVFWVGCMVFGSIMWGCYGWRKKGEIKNLRKQMIESVYESRGIKEKLYW